MRSIVTDQDRNCLVCQFQQLTGFQRLETGRNLEITPTLTGNLSEERELSGGRFTTADEELEPGLSARWGITPNVALNLTVNPDFSQVEADAAQLDVNERFALFFPEKRPFFLEGADFFETQLPLVFTRTVADPVAGLKLTGKQDAHALGAFFAQDRINRPLTRSWGGTLGRGDRLREQPTGGFRHPHPEPGGPLGAPLPGGARLDPPDLRRARGPPVHRRPRPDPHALPLQRPQLPAGDPPVRVAGARSRPLHCGRGP